MMTQGFVGGMFRELRVSEYTVEALIIPDQESEGVDVDITDEDENEEDHFNLAKELDRVTYKEGSKVMNLANIIADPETYGFYKSATGEPANRSASTAIQDNIERLPNQNEMIEAII